MVEPLVTYSTDRGCKMLKDYLKSNNTTSHADRELSTLLYIILTIHKGGRVVVILPAERDTVGEEQGGGGKGLTDFLGNSVTSFCFLT